MAFLNRRQECAQVAQYAGQSGFGVVTGRRRIGKTALLLELCRRHGGVYHQAVEGTAQQQLHLLATEWAQHFPVFRDVIPANWNEFLALLTRESLPPLLVFDEFPYFIAGARELPSILQKWADHELPKHRTLLLVAGSSQSMMHAHFLQGSAPLYGRSRVHLHLGPMHYQWFCHARKLPPDSPLTFARFAVTGGVPHYWQLLPRGSLWQQLDTLFFAPSALLADEAQHLLFDEGVTGNIPKAIVDLVGRGVAKPGELASRLGTPHSNLSRPLALLLDVGLIARERPFGESVRTTKRVQYYIPDPALAFYYGVYVPHRHHWQRISQQERQAIVHQHTATQWERFCRASVPGAARYWESPDLEIDLVAPLKKDRHLVAECKWRRISAMQEKRLLKALQQKFAASRLRTSIAHPVFQILGQQSLGTIARQSED